MKKLINCFLCLFLLNVTQLATAANAMQLEIIPLKHRLVNDIVPILQPLVVEGGSLSGMNNQLIIRTTKQNLKELQKVLAVIDKPLRSLKITVQFDQTSSLHDSGQAVEGGYERNNTRITTTSTHQTHGSSVTVRGNDSALRYNRWNTESQHNDDNAYFVRTVEGQEAWINVGQIVPRAYSNVYLYADGVDVHESIEYQDISSGFYVEPTLSGQQVTLNISPKQSRISASHAGRIATQSGQMTVTGNVGEWIDLGGVSTQHNTQDKRNLSITRTSGGSENHIFVRVDVYQ